MDELKPCPFCGSKAKFGVNKSCCGKTVRIDCTNAQCGANINAFSSKAEAIKVWNRRAAPENKPLTLEQLRQMDGEPVWLRWTGRLSDREDRWAIVHMIHPQGTLWDLGDYGKTWLAYARKPEGSVGDE